ncbi:hypothetical protein ACIRFG_21660 [Streptomyces sp. NPDC102424]|uniref:hypothetical protein n=1 Tax=Streptomyces sp. NPDC102424 TaxID=3366174 RepID=UPI0037F4B7FC
MDSTVDPLDTEPTDVRGAALAALRGWATRRDRLADNRADLMAAAWWAGTRIVAELARAADVSRDTVYDDLRARGVEPTDKTAEGVGILPPYAPLTAEPVRELAQHAWSLVRPAMLTCRPDWATWAAWHLSIALDRIGILLEDSTNSDRKVDAGESLLALLAAAQEAAQKHWAELDTPRKEHLTAFRTAVPVGGEGQAVIHGVELTLGVSGSRETFSVRFDPDPFEPAGWTAVSSDHPQLGPQLTAADRLAIQTAVHTLGRLLNRRLYPDDTDGSDSAMSEPGPTVPPVRPWPGTDTRG